ncbi:MAG: primary-amine oxidase [Actinomycetota bacterium]
MHPLSMMTEAEVETAKRILRDAGHVTDTSRFHGCCIHEPPKKEVAAWQPGDEVDRRLDLVVRNGADVYEATVSVTGNTVDRWEHQPGVVPRVGLLELRAVMEACRANPDFRAALAKRGIDLGDGEDAASKIQIDPWPTGDYGLGFEDGRRVQRCIAFYRPEPTDNGYARPVDGIIVHVDVDTLEVLHVEDFGEWPLPSERGNYDVASVEADYGPMRTDLKQVDITQPDGVSFTLEDNELTWQRWKMRIVMDDTEGLVLHRISYTDGAGPDGGGGTERPIIDRASLAEMVVPYGDTRPSQTFKHALDAGEFGLGLMANSLTLGCDCLGEIVYLDAAQLLDDGTAFTLTNAICIHEEDFGIGWKHTDTHADTVEVRRSRRLVVSSIHTVGNYEYGLFWYFHLDGSIRFEIKLTGILTTRGHTDGDDLTFARQVAPEVSAPIHQHLFCVRLDMAVDGHRNSVVEVNTEALPPGPDNPVGTAFAARETVLTSEHEAMRTTNSSTSRYWRIQSEEATNRLDRPTAYRLLPSSTAIMFAAPESPHASRAGFAHHNLWVTPTSAEERYAAGPYPTQRNQGHGLPAYTEGDRPVTDTDVTLWHTFGLTHDVRVEDYPVMPTEYAGFLLVPDGFFDRNPALDVPPSSDHCH